MSEGLTGARRLVVLTTVLVSSAGGVLNAGIVSTAMPKVVADLGGISVFSWVFTAFMLTSTTSIPIAGKLSDVYGRKRVVIVSLSILTVGSLLCGISGSMAELIVFRAFQGLGAGPIMGIAFAIVADYTNVSERARWQGFFSSTAAVALLGGPIIGGAVTDHLGWRWTFYVTPPLTITCIAVLLAVMPSHVNAVKPRVDFLGAICLSLAVVPLLLALTWADHRYSWDSVEILGLLALALGMTAIFLLVERSVPQPILPTGMFANAAFRMGAILYLVQGAALGSQSVYIPLFVQGVLGYTATNSGLLLAPQMLTLAVGSLVMMQIAARWRRQELLVIISCLPVIPGMFLLSQVDPGTTRTEIMLILVPIGFSTGNIRPLTRLIVQERVERSLMGIATSSLEFFSSIGMTLGLAVAGTIFNSRFQDQVQSQISPEVHQAATDSMLQDISDPRLLLNQQLMGNLRDQFLQVSGDGERLFALAAEGARGAMASAIASVFFLSLILCVAVLVYALLIPSMLKSPRVERTEPAQKPVPPPVAAPETPSSDS